MGLGDRRIKHTVANAVGALQHSAVGATELEHAAASQPAAGNVQELPPCQQCLEFGRRCTCTSLHSLAHHCHSHSDAFDASVMLFLDVVSASPTSPLFQLASSALAVMGLPWGAA